MMRMPQCVAILICCMIYQSIACHRVISILVRSFFAPCLSFPSLAFPSTLQCVALIVSRSLAIDVEWRFFSSSVQYPAMGVALYRYGDSLLANTDSTSTAKSFSILFRTLQVIEFAQAQFAFYTIWQIKKMLKASRPARTKYKMCQIRLTSTRNWEFPLYHFQIVSDSRPWASITFYQQFYTRL